MRKAFDEKLFQENDALARKASAEFIKSLCKDVKVFHNSDKYAQDLIVMDLEENPICYIECEIKRLWKGSEFPFPTLQIPERKGKYIGSEPGTLFLVFNADQTAVMLVHEELLAVSPKEEIPNKYVQKGEFFFQVPRTYADLYVWDGVSWLKSNF